MSDFTKQVEKLVNRAADAAGAFAFDEALKFSQAACNVANAMRIIHEIEHPPKILERM